MTNRSRNPFDREQLFRRLTEIGIALSGCGPYTLLRNLPVLRATLEKTSLAELAAIGIAGERECAGPVRNEVVEQSDAWLLGE